MAVSAVSLESSFVAWGGVGHDPSQVWDQMGRGSFCGLHSSRRHGSQRPQGSEMESSDNQDKREEVFTGLTLSRKELSGVRLLLQAHLSWSRNTKTFISSNLLCKLNTHCCKHLELVSLLSSRWYDVGSLPNLKLSALTIFTLVRGNPPSRKYFGRHICFGVVWSEFCFIVFSQDQITEWFDPCHRKLAQKWAQEYDPYPRVVRLDGVSKMSSTEVDVVVVGAGVSGLTAAHHLSKKDSSIGVLVLEAKGLCAFVPFFVKSALCASSCRSRGQLGAQHSWRWTELWTNFAKCWKKGFIRPHNSRHRSRWR